MRYVSTRGKAEALPFEGALLAGLARDDGLYMPEAWPRLSPAEIGALAGLDYEEAAYRIMRPYLEGDPSLSDLEAVLDEAYGGFHHPAIAPLRQIGPASWLLELFHGPTLAFKDLAMQVVARLMNRALLRRGARATIVGDTSGDTGGGVQLAANRLDLLGDGLRAAAVGAFEGHMLEKMSDAVLGQAFAAATGAHPDAERDGLYIGPLMAHHGEAIGQSGHDDTHAPTPVRALFAALRPSPLARAWLAMKSAIEA